MIITLTTDFGAGSRYIAAMKGVILTINSAARIIDLSHTIPSQNIQAGAIALAETAPLFPPGTIHVAVVDPGVGTKRPIVYAEIGTQRFVAPDNGLLSRLADSQRVAKIIDVSDPRWWRANVSRTFHGRDILAPVAAHLSVGLAPNELGEPLTTLYILPWPEVQKVANQIDGQISEVDSFGNLISNISREMLQDVPTDESVTILCDGHETQGIFDTYAEQPSMTLIALVGSGNHLELAIVDENASIMLGAGVGSPVRVSW